MFIFNLNKNLILKILLCILILNCINITGLASNWVEVGYKRYLDYDSYQQLSNDLYPNRYAVWEKSLNNGDKRFKDIEKQKGKKIWYSLTRFGADCSDKTVNVLDIIYYDLSGKVIQSDRFSEYSGWNSIVPDSLGAFYYNMMCKPESTY